ncbi:MAG TPA: acyltransferase family protein [Streptosporangiaceae bacterium]|jgi:fucose 4-O-acetylase-like acetyltransferase
MAQTSVERQVQPDHDAKPTKPPEGNDRDAFFDNAKFFAILLVVVGHSMEPLRDNVRAAAAGYMWIYIFHMPAFIVIAGYFTKNFEASTRKIQRLIGGVVVPYLIFEVAYTAQLFWTRPGDPPNWSLLAPAYLDWFLASLFMWRLTSPIWRYIRWPLAVATGVSLLAGLGQFGQTLGMTRTLQLLPFFVLGMVLRREHFEYLHRPWVRAAAVAALAVTAVVVALYLYKSSAEWVYWRKTLADRDINPLYGTAVRAGLLVGTTVITASFLALIPRKRHWFTSLGAGTIYAYLLHGLVVRTAKYFHVYDHLHSVLGLGVVIVCAVGLALVMMSPPVRFLTRWAVEPTVSWLFPKSQQVAKAPPG